MTANVARATIERVQAVRPSLAGPERSAVELHDNVVLFAKTDRPNHFADIKSGETYVVLGSTLSVDEGIAVGTDAVLRPGNDAFVGPCAAEYSDFLDQLAPAVPSESTTIDAMVELYGSDPTFTSMVDSLEFPQPSVTDESARYERDWLAQDPTSRSLVLGEVPRSMADEVTVVGLWHTAEPPTSKKEDRLAVLYSDLGVSYSGLMSGPIDGPAPLVIPREGFLDYGVRHDDGGDIEPRGALQLDPARPNIVLESDAAGRLELRQESDRSFADRLSVSVEQMHRMREKYLSQVEFTAANAPSVEGD